MPLRLFYRGFEEHDNIDLDDGSDKVGLLIHKSFDSLTCPNCQTNFDSYTRKVINAIFLTDSLGGKTTGSGNSIDTLLKCSLYGWWQLKKIFELPEYTSNWAYQYHGVLENVDIGTDQVKLSDLRKWPLFLCFNVLLIMVCSELKSPKCFSHNPKPM